MLMKNTGADLGEGSLSPYLKFTDVFAYRDKLRRESRHLDHAESYLSYCSPSSERYPHPVTQQRWLLVTVWELGGRHTGWTSAPREEGQGFFSCSRAMS